MFSGGLGSYLAAKRVVAQYSCKDVTLVFADTAAEDPDLYRFLDEASQKLACPLVIIRDGRTPWEVFEAKKFLGNSRVDICSRVLKREPCQRWLTEHCDPAQTRIYVGIDWTESHRYERIVSLNETWAYFAPLCEAPYLTPQQAREEVENDGLKVPVMYDEGFAHNNCMGGCVKAGQAHWALLLQKRPAVFAYHEQKENEFRQKLGKNVSILTDRRGGRRTPLTLTSFRQSKENGEQHDKHDWGGCGCYSGSVSDVPT